MLIIPFKESILHAFPFWGVLLAYQKFKTLTISQGSPFQTLNYDVYSVRTPPSEWHKDKATGQTRPLGYGSTPLVLRACGLGRLATDKEQGDRNGYIYGVMAGNKKEIHENHLEPFLRVILPRPSTPAPPGGISPKFGASKNKKRVINSRPFFVLHPPKQESGIFVCIVM